DLQDAPEHLEERRAQGAAGSRDRRQARLAMDLFNDDIGRLWRAELWFHCTFSLEVQGLRPRPSAARCFSPKPLMISTPSSLDSSFSLTFSSTSCSDAISRSRTMRYASFFAFGPCLRCPNTCRR